MALVDYSSDSDSGPDQKEDQKGPDAAVSSTAQAAAPASPATQPPLPPLPASFHDLYASTVRTSTRDDPSLHQGRTRQIPHVAGNWPSHVYVEWFPTAEEYESLGALLVALRPELGEAVGADGGGAGGGSGLELRSFLRSDLDTPLPLHISLSRPFVLTTDQKDDFVRRLTVAVQQQTAITRFAVRPCALSWHKSPDSNRAFLVLRVREDAGGNPGLAALLSKCNNLICQFGQPPLYVDQQQQQQQQQSTRESNGGNHAVHGIEALDRFHVSVAWSFADVTEELRTRTAAVYDLQGFRDPVGTMRVPVAAVKVKIGNVVTSLTLPESRKRRRSAGGLLGL